MPSGAPYSKFIEDFIEDGDILFRYLYVGVLIIARKMEAYMMSSR